jgi:hypothetical protein
LRIVLKEPIALIPSDPVVPGAIEPLVLIKPELMMMLELPWAFAPIELFPEVFIDPMLVILLLPLVALIPFALVPLVLTDPELVMVNVSSPFSGGVVGP